MGNMIPVVILFSLSLLLLGQVMLLETVHQQLFSRTDAVPTNSCHKIGRPVINLNHCMLLCLLSFKCDMISVNIFTKECMCCDFALSGTVQNAAEWISFYQKCPDGYSEMTYKSVHTCLKYVSTQTSYDEAFYGCQRANGDLIRLDSSDKFHIFQQFLDYYATADDIWIQAVKDSSSILRFHDGTKFGNHCPLNLDGEFENHLRYKVSASEFRDFFSNGSFSYMCEYDFCP